MTITLLRSGERAHVSDGDGERWTDSASAVQIDPLSKGDRALESLTEHNLAPGKGFSVRAGADHEVITYVEEGTLIQQDSDGRTGRLRAGDFRRARARGGTNHSGLNPSSTDRAHVFQSGIASDEPPLQRDAEQKRFPLAERKGLLRLIASPDGREGSLRIGQDVHMYSSLLYRGTHLVHALDTGRRGWLHVVAGRIQLGDLLLGPGDGAGLAGEAAVSFTAREPSEVLLFDLP